MQVMQAIAEILSARASTLSAFRRRPSSRPPAAAGIRRVICRQERVGVHMADGFARVTNGRPLGVFAMQYGQVRRTPSPASPPLSDSTPLVSAAARPPAGDGAGVSDVQFGAHLRLGDQIGREAVCGRTRCRRDAARLQRSRRTAGPARSWWSCRRCGRSDIGSDAARLSAGAPDAVPPATRATWRRRRSCWWTRAAR